ncbi:hypothetical protein [Ancylomarina longa]|uniref:DUF1735 domain-containing protein n=1 Tax=Ancylomarina longa TaxID=2487017 RepID=A0A434AWG2_9BACT|nr:hypothetical protein [Ancylomarina longa]RUT78740.1 hypothetical protein DLK05_06265 [Ancylomarina longa]
MKITNLLLAAIFLSALLPSCSKDKDQTYGPEYEINDIELNADYLDRDTIPAKLFAMQLVLKSDNKYAAEYGLNPLLKSKIAAIKVTVLTDGMHPAIAKDNDVSRFFLIDDWGYHHNLYQTIPQYIEQGEIKSLSPVLYFTDQMALAPNSETIITDTIALAFRVELKLKNNQVFSDQDSIVLIP